MIDITQEVQSVIIKNLRGLGIKYRNKKNSKKVQVS